jgi:CHAT domain-containing protein
LLPVNTSHLGLESRVVRRLRDVGREPRPISFAAGIESLIETREPLKVLLAGADPRNSLESLDDELTKLKERIEVGCQALNLRCSVSVLAPMNATRAALEKRLEDTSLGPFHIFHFCGHGTRGSNPDESSLVLRGSSGADDAVSCEKLRLMLQNRVLWMAYLSCCYGAATRGAIGIEQQYVGTIHAVLSAGIPAAIGFRWAVSDRGAYALARCFYEQLFALGQGLKPSQALWTARRNVAGDKYTRDAWASSLMVSQFAE